VVEAIREEMELRTADGSHHELHDEGASVAEVAAATCSFDREEPDVQIASVADVAQAAGSPDHTTKLGDNLIPVVQSADGISATSRDQGQLPIPSVQQLKRGAAEFQQARARVTSQKITLPVSVHVFLHSIVSASSAFSPSVHVYLQGIVSARYQWSSGRSRPLCLILALVGVNGQSRVSAF
jgi:hypothetical protein